MEFESLPNEVLIECFQYLNSLDLFYSFNQLNYRFYKLIRNIRLYLNFGNVRKPTVDQFCYKILLNSSIKRQIYSLHLSNKDTAGQIRTFLSWFSLHEFTDLHSLTLTEVAQEDVRKLKVMLPLIPRLSCFRLVRSEVKSGTIDGIARTHTSRFRDTLSSIQLSDLKLMEKIPSLTNLTLVHCELYDLYKVLKNVPMLKYLNCQNVFKSYILSNYLQESFDYRSAHIKQLIMTEFKCDFENFGIFAQHTPNLRCLTITAENNKDLIDACRWEHLIPSSLSQLTVFRFKFTYSSRDNGNDVLDKFEQFQSDFWQNRHQWHSEYVLHTYSERIGTNRDIPFRKYSAQIYTIPYVSNVYMLTQNPTRSYKKSQNRMNTFDKVTNLIIYGNEITEIGKYYFSNVTSLTLLRDRYRLHENTNTSVKDYTESLKMITNLSNVKHLDISGDRNIGMSFVLLEILKAAPYVSSLGIDSNDIGSLFGNDDLQQCLNSMIKKLSIYGPGDHLFDNYADLMDQFCQIFSNIEELKCPISQPHNWLFLLNRFPKLLMTRKY